MSRFGECGAKDSLFDTVFVLFIKIRALLTELWVTPFCTYVRTIWRIRRTPALGITWMNNTGELLRTRYRGLTRNAIYFALNAMAYNVKISLSLNI